MLTSILLQNPETLGAISTVLCGHPELLSRLFQLQENDRRPFYDLYKPSMPGGHVQRSQEPFPGTKRGSW